MEQLQKDNNVKNEHIWNEQEPQPIAVPLLGHHAQHEASADLRNYNFVGREHLTKDLITILNETRNTKGCYLISGFRGSGKTSLINKVLGLYARGAAGSSWLPAESGNINSFKLKLLLARGRDKLIASSRSEKNTSLTDHFIALIDHFLSGIIVRFNRLPPTTTIKKNIFSQLIIVKINLGQGASLDSKDVLFNTTTLLYQKLRGKHRFIRLMPCSITAFFTTWVVINFISGWFNAWVSALLPPCKNSAGCWLPLINDHWINWVAYGLIVTVAVYYIWTRYLPTTARVIHLLAHLNKRMTYTIEVNQAVQHSRFSFSRKETMPPLNARQIENELLFILKECRKAPQLPGRLDIVFVFDELDKIAHRRSSDDSNTAHPASVGPTQHASVGRDLHERKKKVDDLLSALKNFMTQGHARFFFIAGREMLDSYQAERGSTSSLYESLFTRIFEVPSLLTDASDHNQQRMHSLMEVYVCRKLMDPDVAIYLWLMYTHRHRNNDPCWKEDLHRKLMYSPFCLRTYYHFLTIVSGVDGNEAQRIVLGLRNFIQFLTLHSWGNPKRMESLFINFTKPFDSVDWRQKENVENIIGPIKNVQVILQFGLLDQQRILLASNLYTQLYHDLGRQLASSGDKLAVSTMAAFQYILKFHRHPFSRYHLERMSETLSIYRSPELNTMIDTLMSKVFHSHIRRIRNSHYRYRFNGDSEQELRYVSRVSDIESAAFNFSLDASAPIKAHYIDQLNDIINKKSSSGKCDVAIYELCMIIGDLFALEQSHDEAFTYYQRAVDVFDKCPEERRIRFTHFYVEALLRLGEIYEQRQRYDQAASVYLHARSAVRKLQSAAGRSWHGVLVSGDSKWDIFRQPFWAYWYLQLKRSPVPSRCKLPPRFEYPFHNVKDPVNHYRAGQLAFFYGCHYTAIGSYLKAIEHSGIKVAQTERTTYIGAYAYLHLGENLFVGMMHYLRSEWYKKNDLKTDHDRAYLTRQAVHMRGEIINAIQGMKTINNIEELEKSYLNESASYRKNLELIRNEKTFLERVDVCKTLGMMAHAAKLLTDRGLHYHASNAYMKIISIWGMISEILFILTEMVNHSDLNTDKNERPLLNHNPAAPILILRKSERWIADARRRAAVNITSLTAGGYGRFQARWKNRDVVFLFKNPGNDAFDEQTQALTTNLDHEWDYKLAPLFEKQKELKKQFELNDDDVVGYDLNNTLDIIFSSSRSIKFDREKRNKLKLILTELKKDIADKTSHIKELGEALREMKIFDGKEIDNILVELRAGNLSSIVKIREHINDGLTNEYQRITRNPIFTQRSMMGQKLINLSIWEYMTKVRFRIKREPLLIPHKTMVPHSTRNLMFSHWLAGRRYLYWEVLAKTNSGEKDDRSKMYNSAAAAIHNFNRTIYYTRQLAGNDQDLMFPDSSMVLYDLWRLLYTLIKWEKASAVAEGKKMGYDQLVDFVKRELSASNFRHHDTPANVYDFNNVKCRTIDTLRDAEQFGDISNRVRTDALRTRHFLADDYEDPCFHLDWTLVQMYCPAAGILRRHVESASKKLAEDLP